MVGIERHAIRVALVSLMAVVMLAGCGSAAPQAIPAPTPLAPTPVPTAVLITDAAPTAASSEAAVAAPATSEPTAVPSAGPAAPSAETASADEQEVAVERPEGWSEESHGNDVDPNYGVVFPQDKVNQIKITLTADDWAAMQANMTELLGQAGTGGRRGGFQGGGNTPPAGGQPPAEGQPPAQGQPPAGGGGRGGIGRNPDMTPTNPAWFPATVEFDDQTWTNVGVRYKGNSSLTSAWRNGSAKLPLKLDFDQFEDEVPAVENQRFYGFKQVSFGNGFSDGTNMRDALAYGLFRDAGLVAPQTAFYEVIVDHGDGPVSLGLYTMVEVVDDTVIEAAFDDDSGNIYEADGSAASLAKGTDAAIKTSFQKENNETEADWSDIQALYDVIHAAERTTSPEAWRANLEAVFDVDAFLKTLAVNAVVQDWDQYGAMNHNYYLYHDPATDKLSWVSWDHNEAFSSRGGPGGRGDGRGATSLDKANVGENWPLIRFLLDDELYGARYKEHLAGVLQVFDSEALAGKIDEMAKLVQPYAVKAGNDSSFDSAVEQLKTTIATQEKALESYLAN